MLECLNFIIQNVFKDPVELGNNSVLQYKVLVSVYSVLIEKFLLKENVY